MKPMLGLSQPLLTSALRASVGPFGDLCLAYVGPKEAFILVLL